MTIAAVIIAAGSSSRLGQPKQLIVFDGEMLLQRAIRLALEAGGDPVLVVLGANRHQIKSQVNFSGTRIVANELWEEGMASSIRAGISTLEAEASEVRGVLLMVCDQPGVTAEHLGRMLRAFRGAGMRTVASFYAGKRGIPAIFPRSSFPDLMALEGDKGARGLLSDPSREVIEVALEGGEIDIDREEDLPKLGPL